MAKRGINKVTIMGALGQDPETRYLQNGDAVTTMSVCTSESWKDKTGAKQESKEWHRVVVWRKLAEIAGEYCRKGKRVYVEGKLSTRKWQDKDGVERYTTEIIADELQIVDWPDDDQGKPDANAASHEAQRPAQRAPAGCDFSDDIPFTRVMNCHAI